MGLRAEAVNSPCIRQGDTLPALVMAYRDDPQMARFRKLRTAQISSTYSETPECPLRSRTRSIHTTRVSQLRERRNSVGLSLCPLQGHTLSLLLFLIVASVPLIVSGTLCLKMTTLDKFKVTAVTWDCKDETYATWDEQMGSLVRSTLGGAALEDWWCFKVGKISHQKVAIPSYLLADPDFEGALAYTADGAAGAAGEDSLSSTSPSSYSSINTLQSMGNKYNDLPEESRKLDPLLYNILLMNVKGVKNSLLHCVSFPSYVQARIVLHKHMAISSSDRKTQAFKLMDQLTYRSDPHDFEVRAVTAFKELLDSNCKIKDYAMTRVMQAFDGKSKTTQHKIAHDINSQDIDSINFFDLIHGYCSDLASVGDNRSSVNALEEEELVSMVEMVCKFCGAKGHSEAQCRKKKNKDKKCTYCGKLYHEEKDCHKKRRDLRKVPPSSEAPTAAIPGINVQIPGINSVNDNTQESDSSRVSISKTGLLSLLEQLEGGNTCHHIMDQERHQEMVRLKATLDASSTPVVNPASLNQRLQCAALDSSDKQVLMALTQDQLSVMQSRSMTQANNSNSGSFYINGLSQSASNSGSFCINGLSQSVHAPADASICLSLCDGIGCLAMVLQRIEAKVSRFIAVETEEDARSICQNANPATATFPGVDHTWKSNVFDIAESDIAALGFNAIKMVGLGPPCEDQSLLRLIRSKAQAEAQRRKGVNPRPGLDGPKGAVFRRCLWLVQVVRKYNPDAEIICENPDFADLVDSWEEVCAVLGEPLLIAHEDFSTTGRFRAYWILNIPLPRDFTSGFGPLEPNNCMDPGRTIRKYTAYGKEKVYPVCGSWAGRPSDPHAKTSCPILVDDDSCHLPQHIRVQEAESMHGIERGRTAGRGATALQRLQGIGRGWDLHVIFMILRHSKLSTVTPGSNPYAHLSQLSQQTGSLSPGTKQLVRCNPDQNSLVGTAKAEEASVQQLLVQKHSELSTPEFATYLAQLDLGQQAICLRLIHSAIQGGAGSNWSVLDSGSSRNLSKKTIVTDPDDRKSLVGFNGSSDWTDGSGYLPLQFTDEDTGAVHKYDLPQVDSMQVKNDILCMGKLLRLHWDFHFTDGGAECIAVSPCRGFTVRIQLGSDDILRMPHGIRTGKDSVPLPNAPLGQVEQAAVLALKRSASDAGHELLHSVFNHCGNEKLFQTLGHTRGYVQVRLSPSHYNTCAITKARAFGLKQRSHSASVNQLQLDQLDIQAVQTLMPQLVLLVGPDHSASVYQLQLDQLDRQVFQSLMPQLVLPVEPDPDPVFSDANAAINDDEDAPFQEFDYEAPVAGRRLGVQSVPRFQLYVLKPFEVMFVDNKDFPCDVRGGYQTCLLFICYKTRAKAKVDEHSKSENGVAFQRIVALHGVHKLGYSCRVYTDGCGSMKLVEAAASKAGIDHAFIPPHQQSLNEAEKCCDQMFAAARSHMLHSQAPDNLFSKAVDFAIYSDMRMSTTESRGWITPYEAVKGVQPDVRKMHRFYTRAFVLVPPTKRKDLAARGLHNYRSEPGRFIGFQSIFSSTYAVMLDKIAHNTDRLVHNINVTFDDTDFVRGVPSAQQPAVAVQHHHHHSDSHVPTAAPAAPAASAEEAVSGQHSNPLFGSVSSSTQQQQMGGPYVRIEAMQWPASPAQQPPQYHDPDDDTWRLNGDGSPQSRPRPDYSGMANTVHMVNSVLEEDGQHSALDLINNCSVSTLGHICLMLANHSQKDMSWKVALKGPMRDRAIEALHSELDSLCDTILEEISPEHPDRARAEAEAISGRFLLDLRRNQQLKARGVKQGFKEDKATADGLGFNYSAHVTKLKTIRLIVLRQGRGNRRLAIKDVRVAFLQSDKFPPHIVKFMVFTWPLTGEKRFFRQRGPCYGEASAPIRWEDTFCPYLESEGFDRGEHDQCAFYHAVRDLVDLLWVDDNMLDGEQDQIEWASNRMDDRFKCKGLVWIEPLGGKEDYLGMEISMDENYTYMSMCQYIWNCIELICDDLGMPVDKFTPVSTPMDQPIDSNSPPLDAKMAKLFMTCTGSLGWLQLTMRIDVCLLYSRAGQHLQAPTESALAAVIRGFRYLKGTINLALASPRFEPDIDLHSYSAQKGTTCGDTMSFYTDSDHGGNSERQNKRRNQYGYVAGYSCGDSLVPVDWHSKVTSCAFANADIGESHADMSSAAGEVYAAGNASCEMLNLKYICEEVNVV